MDWKEPWIDRMGLIVALGGEQRFKVLRAFKRDMAVKLTVYEREDLREAIRKRFTPTNGSDGCAEAMASVKQVSE